jgi:hypothetical protein
MDRLSPIEHAVMWIGAYEFLHAPDVPWRVVLNECIELAKEFGGTDGHKYVNARAQRPGAAAARRRSGSRRAEGKARREDLQPRAERIEPFYVMEVAKAASQSRASSPTASADDLPEHRRAGFHRPALVQEAAARAIRDGRTQYTTPPAWTACASASATGTRNASSERAGQPHRRHGRRLGRAAAGLPGADRRRRRDPDAGPELPCNRHFVSAAEGRRRADPDDGAGALPAQRREGAGAWGEHTRGVLLASPPIPPAPRSTRTNCAASTSFVSGKGGITLLDEIYLGLSYDETFGHTALGLDDRSSASTASPSTST